MGARAVACNFSTPGFEASAADSSVKEGKACHWIWPFSSGFLTPLEPNPMAKIPTFSPGKQSRLKFRFSSRLVGSGLAKSSFASASKFRLLGSVSPDKGRDRPPKF
jgi:hypothetical protein